MLGLYLHVPFCGKICDYCDFYAISAPKRLYLEYLDLVSREIEAFALAHTGTLEKVETLYVGGGTPSILPPEMLSRLYDTLASAGVPLHRLRESTMEFNPESCDSERLAVALEHGVTRASIGIQSFDSEQLDRIGRRHDAGMGMAALDLLLSQGGLRVSADLMFNLPGQTVDAFLKDLDRLSDYGLGHISFYGLKVDENSRLGHRIAKGELAVDEELYGPMYCIGVELLAKKGFERYETSNFARSGQESLHNLNYWKRGEYLAFGPGAHGFLGEERYYAPEMYARWRDYVREGCPREKLTLDPLEKEDVAAEIIQLSLRTKYGLDLARLRQSGYQIPSQKIEKWVSKDYLLQNGETLVLKGNGWLFMDSVVEDLFCSLEAHSNLE